MEIQGRDTTNDFYARYERGVRTYTIYFDPEDFPGQYVVRGWTSYVNHSDPDKECEVAGSLEAAREKIPSGMVWQARHMSDPRVVVESWVWR